MCLFDEETENKIVLASPDVLYRAKMRQDYLVPPPFDGASKFGTFELGRPVEGRNHPAFNGAYKPRSNSSREEEHMARKTRVKYVGNTPGLDIPARKRKRNPNDYKPPAKQKQKKADQEYVAFQGSEPRTNRVTQDLKIKQICDTIIGGKKVWLRGETKDNPPEQYKFPIVVGGRRCTGDAVIWAKDHRGKSYKRCRDHLPYEDAWIDTGEMFS
jgi:hypothetical protein